ncbi:DUF1799 domain-containing protein [Segnochrobactrum spirostomi]|nr:DUF1799 domain-containing protein [Segnochrobactrum spirostomi]
MRAEFARLGVAIEVPDADPETVEVMVELWPAVRLFTRLGTQWRSIAGYSGVTWIGLDYAAVDVAMRRLGAEGVNFEDLQALEQGALGVLNGGV